MNKIFKSLALFLALSFVFAAPVQAVRADLLNEPFNVLGTWTDTDTDTAVSEIDPAGQLRLDTNLGAAGDAISRREKIIVSPPNQFTIEIGLYIDAGGTWISNDTFSLVYSTGTWMFLPFFCTDGLLITKTGVGTTEVGTDIVSVGVLQNWRFQVDKSAGEASAVVEVFLNNVSQGTFDCDYEVVTTDGRLVVLQRGYTTDNRLSHVHYLKIATGLGPITQGSQMVLF